MGIDSVTDGRVKKKLDKTDREMTTALYMVRCKELGLSFAEESEITMGMVMDMLAEKLNDTLKYPRVATQEDFDRF